MLVFFVGGPWNNQLREIGGPMQFIVVCQGDFHDATYYPDIPLRTGVPVMSSLWGQEREPPANPAELRKFLQHDSFYRPYLT
jgi:hypothetical protein